MSTTEKEDKFGPNVRFPPPFIFLVGMGIGYWLNHYYPLLFWNGYFWVLIGSTGVILSMGVLAYALLSFLKARTAIEPWHPASTLIITGLYRYSRNPIYVTFFILTISIGLMLSNYWIVLSAMPSLWVVRHYVIKREELYLQHRFGDKYLRYCQKVGRWL